MMDFYSIETEMKYRKEELYKSTLRVVSDEHNTFWFKLKQLHSRLTSKADIETNSQCDCACAC